MKKKAGTQASATTHASRRSAQSPTRGVKGDSTPSVSSNSSVSSSNGSISSRKATKMKEKTQPKIVSPSTPKSRTVKTMDRQAKSPSCAADDRDVAASTSTATASSPDGKRRTVSYDDSLSKRPKLHKGQHASRSASTSRQTAPVSPSPPAPRFDDGSDSATSKPHAKSRAAPAAKAKARRPSTNGGHVPNDDDGHESTSDTADSSELSHAEELPTEPSKSAPAATTMTNDDIPDRAKGKRVQRVDTKVGVFLGDHDSIYDAAKAAGCEPWMVYLVCEGRLETAAKYFWRYEGSSRMPFKSNYGKEFWNNRALEIATDHKRNSSVWKTLRSEKLTSIMQRQSGAAADAVLYQQLQDIPPGNPSKVRRPVEQLDYDTGRVLTTYTSISAAARAIGTSQVSVSVCLSGKTKSCKGFFWRYLGSSLLPPPRKRAASAPRDHDHDAAGSKAQKASRAKARRVAASAAETPKSDQ